MMPPRSGQELMLLAKLKPGLEEVEEEEAFQALKGKASSGSKVLQRRLLPRKLQQEDSKEDLFFTMCNKVGFQGKTFKDHQEWKRWAALNGKK